MKVLVFMTQFYHLSGAERLAVELAQGLNQRGVRADVLSMYTEDLPGVAEATGELRQRGIPSVRFLGMKIHPSPFSMWPAILRLRRLLRDEAYDIVETSMISPAVLASWAVWGLRTRHVAGLHHVFREDLHRAPRHRFWQFSLRCNRRNRYYGVSDCTVEQWIRYSKTPPQHSRRIYNAISDDCFSAAPEKDAVRQEQELPENARLVLYVGRLAEYKGIAVLLDALGPILESRNLALLYAGEPDPHVPGTTDTMERMKNKIRENAWEKRVRFLGYRKDIPRLMASSDVLAHPTRTESFGLTLVEALAAGLPVVAADIEGIREVLQGTDARRIPPDDPAALRDAVLETLDRAPEAASAAREKGRRRAEDFRMARRLDAMMNLFEDTLAGRF